MLTVSYTKLLSTICVHYEKCNTENLEVELCSRKRKASDRVYDPEKDTVIDLYTVHVSPRIKVTDIDKSIIHSLVFLGRKKLYPYICNCIYPIAYDPSLIVVAFTLESGYSSRLVIFKRLEDGRFTVKRNDFITPIEPIKADKKKKVVKLKWKHKNEHG